MPALTVFANPRKRGVAATLTNRVEEIRYRHREDGKWYKHKFAPGASVKLLTDGTALITRKDGKSVWMDDSPLDSGGDDMHFFINPKRGTAKKKSSRRSRRSTKARHPVARHSPKKRSTDMAKKRARKRVVRHRRRSASVARKHKVNPRRRRRRAVAVTHYAANPRRRRRRHAVAHTRRRRNRTYRRNPSFGINFLVEGLKDGAGVVVGQVGARKIGALAKQYVPGMSATTGVMSVLPTLAGAIGTAFIARKALPKYSRVITAGAFAEAITQGLAQTPVASYLNAWPAGGARVGTVSAWPARPALPAGQPAPGMRAWPSRRVGLVKEVG